MHHFRTLTLLCLGFILGAAAVAGAGEPAVQLSGQIDDAVKLLNDPALRVTGHAGERRAAIRRMAAEIFDFDETAKRLLGQYWNERTPDEQQRFVRVFIELVDHAYLRRVDDFGGQRLIVGGQTVQNDEARVQVQVIARDNDVTPIEFLMVRAGDGWRAYDVKIGGMSLVASYRAQFNKIIRAASYEELMRRLEARVGGRNDVVGASPESRSGAALTP